MFQKIEIRLSGSGGQGLILGGIILADAAIEDGLNAIQSQSYGPEARGGASKAEVIISKDEIYYPKVMNCDLLLCLTQKSYDKYIDSLNKSGILIVDESVEINKNASYKTYELPIIDTAANKVGTPMVANIVSLGVIQEVCKMLNEEVLKNSIVKRVPRGTADLNIKAFEKGKSLVKG